jgi:hypothetical protein
LESASGSGAAGGADDAAGADVVEEEVVDPAEESSDGLGFGLARLNTGGPSGGSAPGFDITALFFAVASFAEAIAFDVCQVPSPSQV